MFKIKSHRYGNFLYNARLWLLLLTLFGLVDGGAARAKFIDSHGDTIDDVVEQQNDSQHTVWRIDAPDIAQISTAYPQIQFLPGDTIRVLAGGCDQTGGMGRTWKRYVYPQGDNTDKLYHGLILIPEAEPAPPRDAELANSAFQLFSRLGDFGVGDGLGNGVGVQRTIPDPLPDHRDIKKNPIFLSLGFEDDGYADNGYYSRDPGNNDQCVNVAPSFVIVSIGHHGALPEDPRLYVGIKPAEFRCQAGWHFVNQGTPTLSYASFQTAFQITWAGKYINPFNEILFQAGKGLASSGNCEGMALLSLAGEDQFVVGDVSESFWHNYPYAQFSQAPSNLQFDINVAHWQQLSGYFIHNWLDSIESDAPTIVSRVEHDLTSSEYNFVYGMLTLLHGGAGHVLVPVAVTHSGEHTYIQVYNPDTPCVGIPDTANLPKVDIVGNHWSYDMGSLGVWSGDNGALGLVSNGMGFIEYHGPDDGWTDQISSLSGILEVIFGADVNVDQVTDSKGRRLMADGKLDMSDKGLGTKILKIPSFAADEKAKRPRSGDSAKVLKVDREHPGSPAQQALLDQYDRDYKDYEESGQIYVVRDPSLTELTFTLSSKTGGKPVRALVNQGDRFIEVKSEAATEGARIHPTLILHDASAFEARGVTLKSSDETPLKVTFTHSRYDNAAKSETLQKSSEVTVTGALKAQLDRDDLTLLTSEASAPATIDMQTIASDAAIVRAPLRSFTTQPIH